MESIFLKKEHPLDQLENYRKLATQVENESLFAKASFSANHTRLGGAELDHRLPYKRDVDRIIHSKAYARYVDKTQVVYLVENDHITHRGLHVQLVSNFARGIAEILRLNLDLVEAIALGHDVGHPPFGHEGEEYLSEISNQAGVGLFAHPWQSCRLLTEIEPLNLGLAVYDGFLCHDGGMNGPRIEPRFGKTWEDHFTDRQNKIRDPDKNINPGTLEGCLVKICDTASYLGKDIEDAINLGIVKREQIPQTILGDSNRQILSTVAQDMIRESYNKEYISLSDSVYEALLALRTFNFHAIYLNPKLKVESAKIKRSYQFLFDTLLQELQQKGEESHIFCQFVHNKSEAYKSATRPERMVIDYISGMTDHYFIKTLERFIVPRKIDSFPC